jgi:hypothetical protein
VIDGKEIGCRGSAEITGYSIIFGTVILSLSISLVAGVPLLKDDAEAKLLEDVESDFVSLDAEVDELLRNKASNREVSVNTGAGVLTAEPGGYVSVKIDGAEVRNKTSSRLSYAVGGSTNVVYSRGSVFRGSEGSAMVSEPLWMIEDSLVAVVLPIVSGSESFSASTATIVAEREPGYAAERVHEGEAATVEIEVGSPESGAWSRFFEGIEDEYPSMTTDTTHSPSQETAGIEFDIGPDDRFGYTEKPVSLEVQR